MQIRGSLESMTDFLAPGEEPEARSERFGRGGFVFRNAWFAAAHAARLGRRPIPRAIAGTPIVLWRDGAGVAHALEDRCPHRRAPLSEGRVRGGEIQCAFHGWRFDGRGRCVAVPTLPAERTIPPAFGVRSFPVVERYGFLWLWWGEADAADEALLPDVPFLEPRGRAGIETEIVFATSQELAMENLLDMTHTDFLHGGFFGDPSSGEETVSVESTDEVVTMIRVAKDRKAPTIVRPFFGFPTTVSYYETIRLHVRSGAAFGIGWADPPGLGIALLLTNLPEAPGRTRQDGAIVVLRRPRREGGRGGRMRWFELLAASWVTRLLAHQDRRMLGKQYPGYQLDDERVDRSVPGDVAGLRFRKVRAELIRRQRAGDLAYPSDWRGRDAAEVMRCDRMA